MSDLVYLDNNATTRPCDEAVEAMLPYLTTWYGNPSSVHRFGQRSRQALDEARSQVAGLVGCSESELVFTGGGTESISTAIRGLLAARAPRRQIITTTVEHSATRELLQALARDKVADVTEIRVDSEGRLDLAGLAGALTEQTALITLLWANNETGVLFPVDEVVRLAQPQQSRPGGAGIPVHVDATQAVGKIRVDFRGLGATAASFASHKFHGPKGAGGLYIRKGARMRPLVVGGPQERGRRGGTENVPGIVGMGAAAAVASARLAEMAGVSALRDALERQVLETIPFTSVNGDTSARLPNTTNIAFHQLEAEAILLLLSEQGICASAGAACSSGSLEPSHVLRAMGIDPAIAHGAIRFSLSRESTGAEVERLLEKLPGIIQRLRRVLPVTV